MGIDELFEKWDRDDLEDQELMSPVEYGRLRGVAPQLVYYHIRNKHLEMVICACGRKCINKADTDRFFQSKKKGKEESGEDVDPQGTLF